jgi:hypothetical protein
MHSRTLAGAGLTAAALAIATAFAGTASAHNVTGSAVAHHAVTSTKAAPAKGACFDNNGSGDTGVGIASENDSTDSGIDSQGAADFSVKKKCTIKSVQTTGVYYNGGGPADSVNVIIYKNKKGVPGSVVKEKDNLSYTDATGIGSLGAKTGKIKLKKGKYFVTFVANMTFTTGGQWGWELTTNQAGSPDQWENQGGEFGVCPTWGDVASCTGYGTDFMVTVG